MKLKLFSMGLSAALVFAVGCGGDDDSNTGGQDASTGGQDASTGGQDASTGGQDASTGGQDASTGGQDASTGGQDAGVPPAVIELKTVTGCGEWSVIQGEDAEQMEGTRLAGSFTENGKNKCVVVSLDPRCHNGDTTDWEAPNDFKFCRMGIVDGDCVTAVSTDNSDLKDEGAKLEGSLLQNGETVAVNLTVTPKGSQQKYTLKTGSTPLNVKNRSCQYYSISPDNGVIDRVSGCWINDNGNSPRAYGYDYKYNGHSRCAVVMLYPTSSDDDIDQVDFTTSSNFHVRVGLGTAECDPNDLFSLQTVSADTIIFGGSESSPHPYIPENGSTGTIRGWLRSTGAAPQFELRLDAENLDMNVHCTQN